MRPFLLKVPNLYSQIIGENEKSIMKSIKTQNVIFPKTKKRLSPHCRTLIQGMLKKQPKERIKMIDIFNSEWMKMRSEFPS